MRNLFVRALITGFGLRLGSELGKFVAQRIFPDKDKPSGNDNEDEDDSLGTVTADPPDV